MKEPLLKETIDNFFILLSCPRAGFTVDQYEMRFLYEFAEMASHSDS